MAVVAETAAKVVVVAMAVVAAMVVVVVAVQTADVALVVAVMTVTSSTKKPGATCLGRNAKPSLRHESVPEVRMTPMSMVGKTLSQPLLVLPLPLTWLMELTAIIIIVKPTR